MLFVIYSVKLRETLTKSYQPPLNRIVINHYIYSFKDVIVLVQSIYTTYYSSPIGLLEIRVDEEAVNARVRNWMNHHWHPILKKI